MRLAIILSAAILTIGGLSSCSSMKGSGLGSVLGNQTGSTATSNDNSKGSDSGSQSLLGSLLSGLIGNNTTVTLDKLEGTWKYSSPECRFTSENALSQAGGAVAANTVETKLAEIYGRLGISSSTCAFTFNQDMTCTMVLGGRSVNGTYTLDPETRALTIKSNTGLIRLNAQVFYSYTTLTILFDAQKLLTVAQMVAAFTGQGSGTIGLLSDLLNNYQGMMIGMNLQK